MTGIFDRGLWISLGHVVGLNSVKIKLIKEGGGSAQIDSVLLNSRPALSASGIDADLKKLVKDDFDVVDASGKGIELEFNGTAGNAILSLSARIEELVIAKTPFQYPLENLYKEIGPNSKFYHYGIEKGNNAAEKEIFHEYSLTGSGHPSGYTYGWASNDERNLYVRIDFTPDDTMDGDKDYAKVYVKTEEGIREFKVSVPETRWGNASFTYTDKVSYQHKVYDFAIPLKEIGITDAGKADKITLAFAAYGTAAPPHQAVIAMRLLLPVWTLFILTLNLSQYALIMKIVPVMLKAVLFLCSLSGSPRDGSPRKR